MKSNFAPRWRTHRAEISVVSLDCSIASLKQYNGARVLTIDDARVNFQPAAFRSTPSRPH